MDNIVEIRELISLYHVVRLNSISKAAEFLEIGQPTVSTHIKNIENSFGVVLFDRIKRPIKLTSEGTYFYELSKPVVETVITGLERLKTEMDYPNHRGSFSFGAYADLVMYHLPPIIKVFRDKYPKVQLKLTSESHTVLVQKIISGDLDMALVTRPETDSAILDFTPVFSSDYVLLTPLGHDLLKLTDVGLRDIARWPLIVLEPSRRTSGAVERTLIREGIQYSVALEIGIMEIAKRYVQIGMGVAATLGYRVHPDDRVHLGVREIKGLFPSAQLGLITLKGKFLSRSIEAFANILMVRLSDLGKRHKPDMG